MDNGESTESDTVTERERECDQRSPFNHCVCSALVGLISIKDTVKCHYHFLAICDERRPNEGRKEETK